MPVFFANRGNTCFFNVAAQLLLNNKDFVDAILSSDFDHLEESNGVLREFRRYANEVRTHTKPRMGAVASIDELVRHFPFLASHVRAGQQGDAIECVDAILDQLSFRGTPRPVPIQYTNAGSRDSAYARVRQSIRQHCGPLEILWGIQEQIGTCLRCNQIVQRELIPFTWISKVTEKRVAEGVDCDACKRRGSREYETRIFEPARSMIVQVHARHRDDGSKDNRPAPMNEFVEITDVRSQGSISYALEVMAYHEGWSFNSGHYTCAIRNPVSRDTWILNSDAHCSVADKSFKVGQHKPTSTYAMLYRRSV